MINPSPPIANVAASFRHDVGIVEAFMRRIRQRLGQSLLARGLPLFLRNGDSISLDPLVNGDWDLLVVTLLRHAAAGGYRGFLFDIGANVGLTSSQCGDSFEQVLMFEPNPEIAPILDLNTKMSLTRCRRKLFPFGLGPEAKSAVLMVPPGNWGAAFVRDEHNAYPDELIARWHRVEKHELERYRRVPIRIEAIADALPPLFANLASEGTTRGAIKVDVEGYERAILKGIAAILPDPFELFVVFESWGGRIDVGELVDAFRRPVHAYTVVRRPRRRGSLKGDLPAMLWRGGTNFRLRPVARESDEEGEGEIVLVVGAR